VFSSSPFFAMTSFRFPHQRELWMMLQQREREPAFGERVVASEAQGA
jgi:hypothetical protein